MLILSVTFKEVDMKMVLNWRAVSPLAALIAVVIFFASNSLAVAAPHQSNWVYYEVGEGGPNKTYFQWAYDRNGGASEIGRPVSKVYEYKNGWVQDLRKEGGEPYIIMLQKGALAAHVMKNGIFRSYREFGHLDGSLGYPTSGEMAVQSSTGRKGWVQTFQNGSLYWYDGQGYQVLNGIHRVYMQCGGHTSRLGFPTSSEYWVTQKQGSTDTDMSHWRTNFENGIWITYRPDHSYTIHRPWMGGFTSSSSCP